MFQATGNRLIRRFDSEILWIEPWGENSLRVRATCEAAMPETDWALLPAPQAQTEIKIENNSAVITNGKITATVSRSGKIRFFNQNGKLLLEEFVRDMSQPEFSSHMRIAAREIRGNIGGAFQAYARFESDPEEKLFGMGQYQQGIFNLKGATLELMQRNSQCTVPFVVSDKGYGMLWHNPAVGEVTFGTNMTIWHAQSTHLIDYWITADDTPAAIVERYVQATGLPPMMPENAMEAFYASQMNVRKRQVVCDVSRSNVTIQAGAMQWMVGNVKATTGIKGVGDFFGKAVRGSVTGESAIKPEYTGNGTLVLEPTYKHILLVDLNDWNGSIVLDDGLFLACESSLKHKAVMRSNFSSAIAGNEGLFNLGIQGKGVICLESPCPREELVEITLDNDVLKVDGNFAIAWSGTLDFTVERSGKSLIGSAASGEGLVNVYRGTGKVLLAPVR